VIHNTQSKGNHHVQPIHGGNHRTVSVTHNPQSQGNHHVQPIQQQRASQQQQQRTQPIQPSPQISSDTGGSISQHAQHAHGQDSDSVALTGRKETTASMTPSAGKVSGDRTPTQVKTESNSAANGIINLAGDSDEESVGGLLAYLANGEPPLQPQGGWRPANTTSEHGQFLVQLIRMGKVKTYDTPCSIWERYTSLRVVDPRHSFREFVRLCRTEAASLYPDQIRSNTANVEEKSGEESDTDYKELCQRLSLRLETKKITENQNKKEIRHLKKENTELKKEVERQNALLNQVRHP